MNSQLSTSDQSPLLRMVAQALNQTPLAPEEGAFAPPITIAPSPKPSAPGLLAQAHPGGPAARQRAAALYARCLTHFRQVVRHGQASDDVGAAIAFFVHANECVLRDQAFAAGPPAALARQFASMVAHSPQWQRATLKERQSYFEQIALIGVLTAESGAQAGNQGPAAVANVKAAARTYVRQLLGVDADAFASGIAGLALQPAVAASSEAIA